jgi:hypothetical protein
MGFEVRRLVDPQRDPLVGGEGPRNLQACALVSGGLP